MASVGDERLRESDLLPLLVNSVVDYAIFALDTEGHVLTWNAGAERLKGYRADEIVGEHFSRFYTEADRQADLPGTVLKEALRHGHWENEGWRVRKDGARFWANVVVTALYGPQGDHRGFAKVTRDLTERKRTEDALRDVLERERETAAGLRELDRMKNDLVAVIAHDLHSPVAVITGFLHVLTEGWATSTEQEKMEMLDRIRSRVGRLRGLVDDVLDVARIEAGELGVERAELDLNAVVSQVAAEMAMTFPGRTITLPADANLRAVGDERRVWQILTNLLSNALKFSGGDEPVEVDLRREGTQIIVAVRDRGPGITAEELPQVFERFVRLPGTASIPGTGIGLFIAKSLAEAQDGQLTVESTPGVGSTFCLALPADPVR